MAWTYTPDFTTSRDKVRFLIGDTVSQSPQMTNEEIAHAVTVEGNIRGAAALCCEHLVARYAAEVDTVTDYGGQLRKDLSQRVKAYTLLARRFRAGGGVYAFPIAGGISQAANDALLGNADFIPPYFGPDMQRDPQTTSTETE